MLANIKRRLYFPIARYFRFFASVKLRRWGPRVVLVTGSSGKTTLLHLLEAQIGEGAKYSFHANSSFGIPFDILDLQRKSLLKTEWLKLFLFAPFMAFSKLPKQKLYVVEADTDRPGEGKFIGEFLRPDIVLWVSVGRTHSMNFEELVKEGKFENVEEAIVYDFGFYLEYCKELAVVNGDSEVMRKQLMRIQKRIGNEQNLDSRLRGNDRDRSGNDELKLETVKKAGHLQKYEVKKDGTEFVIDGKVFRFPALFPEEVFYSLGMCLAVMKYLDLKVDESFAFLRLPPGRSSVFRGIRDTIIVDSSYNANYSSMQVILEMFAKYPSNKKWAVIGDMLEQGGYEKEEHEKLAELLVKYDFDRIILMGPRVSRYTYPSLVKSLKLKVQSDYEKSLIEKFTEPKEVLDYLLEELQGGEAVLFKGARFMEGIIEHLLKDKADVKKLARREEVWERRRKRWRL